MRSTIILKVMLLACATLPQAASAQMQAASKPEAPKSYLTADQLADAKAYLGPPPAPGSSDFAADRAAHEAALKDQGGLAWKRAQSQLSVGAAPVRSQMLCAIGAKLDFGPTSAFARLMQRSTATIGVASEQSKSIWNRPRPYVGAAKPVACDPKLDFGVYSASYPSGHGALGWLWGLILTEIAPERANQAMAWGSEIGTNRIACGVHYPSDVAAGRQMGAVLYARLQADPAFRADMAAAKAEYAAAKASGATPSCDTE